MHAEQRRGRSQARIKCQAKICGREFSLIPLRNEGVGFKMKEKNANKGRAVAYLCR